MSPQRLIISAAVGLTIAAAAAPAASAQDLRTADARDQAPVVRAVHDLRSPDARVGVPPQTAAVGVDLRTPDARDAADGRGTFNAPDVIVVKLREPAPAPVSASDGLDWGDAGIGAGVLFGLAALGLGAAFAAVHRRGTATPV